MLARWIRFGPAAQREFDAAYTALAHLQPASAPPILLWSEEAARYPFALIAPRRLAPGRDERWLSWRLAAAVATYRQFDLPAHLDGEIYPLARSISFKIRSPSTAGSTSLWSISRAWPTTATGEGDSGSVATTFTSLKRASVRTAASVAATSATGGSAVA